MMEDTNRLTRKQKIVIVLAVVGMWSSSNAYESYLKWDLERTRIAARAAYQENSTKVLEEVIRKRAPERLDEFKKRLGAPQKENDIR